MNVHIKSFRSYMLYVLTMAKAINDCQCKNNAKSLCVDSCEEPCDFIFMSGMFLTLLYQRLSVLHKP